MIPFVRQNDPFVCINRPNIVPFVGFFKPFVRIRANSTGFTLIELMITLLVIGVLAAISGPAFQRFMDTNRLTTATNSLVTDLTFARTEAIKRNQGTVAACVSADGNTCSDSATWQAGWIVYWDQNGNGVKEAGDMILKVHPAFPDGVATVTDPVDTRLASFNGRGARPLTQPELSIQVSHAGIGVDRLVCVARIGRINVAAEGAAC